MWTAIKTAFGAFWSTWKLKLLALAVALNIALLVWVYFKGKDVCEQQTLVRTITKTITVKEKQNEIRNNKPTVTVVASRMRAGSF